MAGKTVRAWHFTAGRRLRDGRRLVVGRTYRLKMGEHPALCERGYHGSRRIIDALQHAPGAMLSRTEHSGEIVEDGDKLVSSERTVLWCVDCEQLLHEAACVFAHRALMRERRAGREPDKRSWDAIRVKRAWLKGKAPWSELKAAWAAARSAAWDAAWAAAWAASWAAAWAAERAWQERYLVRLVNKARKEQEVQRGR